MKLKKVINDKVKKDYFLIEGSLDIDSKYFIKEINKAIQKSDNNNFKTNVQGFMTPWEHFNYNKKFLKKASIPLADIAAQNLKMNKGEKSEKAIKKHAEEWIKSNQKTFNSWIN